MSEASELLLAEQLMDAGILSRDAFKEVMKTRPVQEVSIRNYLVHRGVIAEKQILSFLSRECSLPIVFITEVHPENHVLSLVSLTQASAYQIFPLREDNNEVVLGIVDPLDTNVQDDLRFCFSFTYRFELLSPEDHKVLLKKYYKMDLDDSSENGESYSVLDEKVDVGSEGDPAVNDAPVVVLLNNILLQAINDHASDVHFEPFEDEFRIRYRIDGTLYDMIPPPRNLAFSVLSRIKVMARMNIAEKRVPQDGRISLKIGGRPIDLRVSTIPTSFGESAVLRVLDRSHVKLELDKIGMGRDILDKVREIIHKPNGIFIATGPTGAGKTTTLYSCLQEINTVDSKIITTEDPVEYDIEGITQVAINDNIGLTFAACLRSILRQDPDRIMVGEIRDLDTMNMAIQASLTGHLVLTTLHTNDSSSGLTRLIDMGVEPFLICSSLEGILAQRLVRKICPDCKTTYVPTEAALKLINLKPEDIGQKKFYKGAGCDQCNGIGYKGRIGIYELLLIDDEIRHLLMQKCTASMIKEAAIRHGMVPLLEDGINKILAGITTIEEVSAWAMKD